MRGTSRSPYCYRVHRAPKARFVGAGFLGPHPRGARAPRACRGGDPHRARRAPWRRRLACASGSRRASRSRSFTGRSPPRRSRRASRWRSTSAASARGSTPRSDLRSSRRKSFASGTSCSRWPTTRRPAHGTRGTSGSSRATCRCSRTARPRSRSCASISAHTPTDHHTLAIAQGFMPHVQPQRVRARRRRRRRHGPARPAREGLDARLGHRPAHPRQPDLRLLAGPLGRQARALLRRRPVHGRSADGSATPVSREAMAQWGPPMPRCFTKPTLHAGGDRWPPFATCGAVPDLTLEKLLTLARLFG